MTDVQKTPCEFAGCDKPLLRAGLCSAHDAQRRRGIELRPLLVRVPSFGPCLADECDSERKGRGYCAMHYQQLMRGEELVPKGHRYPCPVAWCSSTMGRNAKACRAHTPRLRQFGITAGALSDMFARQGGACAICLSPESGWSDWHIDHDHGCCPGAGSCGECVRGLLCGRCNIMLGHAKDDPDLLASAITYLRGTLADHVSDANVVQMKRVSQHGNADHQAESV
jgi:hypothetical protein